jgi:hypothetical protein
VQLGRTNKPVSKKITILASGDVKVMVRSEEEKAKLFPGTVKKFPSRGRENGVI